jgi:hypothetical protein
MEFYNEGAKPESEESLESVGIKIGNWNNTPDSPGRLYNQYIVISENDKYIIRSNNCHPDHNRQYTKLGTFDTERDVIQFLRNKGIIE